MQDYLSLGEHKTPIYHSEQFFKKNSHQVVFSYIHGYREDDFPLLLHQHDFYEINLVIDGRGTHYFNKQKLSTCTGDLFIIPPHIKHGYTNEHNLKIFHSLLSPDFFKVYPMLKSLNGYKSLFDIEPSLRSTDIHNFLHLSRQQREEALNDIQACLNYSQNNMHDFNIQSAIIFQMLCKYCKYYTYFATPSNNHLTEEKYTALTIYAMEYIQKHFAENITIDKIASELFVSKSTLQRYFKQVANISPIRYLMQQRLNASKDMLVSTNKSISFIAVECGFFDTSHFIRTFKQYEGVSPTDYRKTF
jgi:AraC family L-rhamnose operon regulatory protein RhaS